MGWTDIFKSKSAAIKPDARVRWFGKLPTYPDYHSSQVDEKWVVEFNDWILRGYEKYQSKVRETGGARGRLPLGAGAVRLPESGVTVLAAILDFGGDARNRPFPMCFYVAVPSELWTGPEADNAGGALSVMSGLRNLKSRLARLLNAPGSINALESFAQSEMPVDRVDNDAVDGAWRAEARAITMSDWFSGATWATADQSPSDWMASVNKWGDSIAALEAADFEPTFRFPLAAGISESVQIAGWLCWLQARMNLADRSLTMCVTGEVKQYGGILAVVARPLMTDDFLLFTGLASEINFVDNAPGAQYSPPIKLEPESTAVPSESVTATWYEFVSRRPA